MFLDSCMIHIMITHAKMCSVEVLSSFSITILLKTLRLSIYRDLPLIYIQVIINRKRLGEKFLTNLCLILGFTFDVCDLFPLERKFRLLMELFGSRDSFFVLKFWALQSYLKCGNLIEGHKYFRSRKQIRVILLRLSPFKCEASQVSYHLNFLPPRRLKPWQEFL